MTRKEVRPESGSVPYEATIRNTKVTVIKTKNAKGGISLVSTKIVSKEITNNGLISQEKMTK